MSLFSYCFSAPGEFIWGWLKIELISPNCALKDKSVNYEPNVLIQSFLTRFIPLVNVYKVCLYMLNETPSQLKSVMGDLWAEYRKQPFLHSIQNPHQIGLSKMLMAFLMSHYGGTPKSELYILFFYASRGAFCTSARFDLGGLKRHFPRLCKNP